MTFAARRTQIWSSEEIGFLLKEDGYEEVSQEDAVPGDIVVYYSTVTGEIEHSGMVVSAAKQGDLRGPLIVSKWGSCQEFIHFFTDCPYLPATIKFYRLHK